VRAGLAPVHQAPDGVPPERPCFLDLAGLGCLDRARGEVVLAGGDLGPDADGRDLALAVSGLGLRARDAGQPIGQFGPCALVDAPVLQRLPPVLVVG
jgi:hypothetical protein